MRYRAFFIGGLLLLCGVLVACNGEPDQDSEADSAEAGTVLIADKDNDVLYFVDRATRSTEDSVEVGRGPHEVAVHPTEPRAFVANYEGEGSISVIDLEERTEIERVDLEPGSAPHGIEVAADGVAVYITAEGIDSVIEMNTESHEIVRTMPTDQEGSHMLTLSPDGMRVYTANLSAGTATAIDIPSGAVTEHIETGEGAEGIAMTHDGSELWVSNRAEDTVSIIDPQTLEVVDTFEVEGFPLRVYMAPDGRTALLSCAQANEVAFVDIGTREVTDRVPTGETPVGIQITPDGEEAFVGNMNDGTVTIIDMDARTVDETLELGSGPDGMAFVE